MVVTPLMKQEVPLELPAADHSEDGRNASRLILSLAADGTAYLNGEPLAGGDVAAHLRPIFSARHDKTLFLEADRSLPYSRVMDAMDDCRAAGVLTIGAVTKREPRPGR
jgi:biopolymer transport protein ExbD